MTIKVTITTTPDITLLASLHGASFDEGWGADGVRGLLAVPGTFALVEDSGSGFALVRDLSDGSAEILTLAVAPAARRQGIAKELVEALREWAESRGVKRVFLEVRESNAGARHLYEKAGFSVISKRKAYYHNSDGSTENAIVLCSSR